jgi:iron complex transport system permease protein
VILLAADILVRILPVQQELKLGVAAALLGGPVFIWIAARLGRASA